MINNLVEKALDKFLRFKSFQDYINWRYNREGYVPVPYLPDACYCINGMFFDLNDQLLTIAQVISDYKFDDIKKDDIVLDIGANIGAFSLFASKKAKNVFSVEPIYADELRKNIITNNVKNIVVFETALGNEILVSWNGINKNISGKSLSEFKKLCGGKIDFLKIDCEGGEWCIRPEELKGIRRIEAEVHNFDGKHKFSTFLSMLDKAGFRYKYEILNKTLMLLHASQQPPFDSISKQPKT